MKTKIKIVVEHTQIVETVQHFDKATIYEGPKTEQVSKGHRYTITQLEGAVKVQPFLGGPEYRVGDEMPETTVERFTEMQPLYSVVIK